MPEQIQEATAAPLALMLKQRFRSPERARNLRSENTSIDRHFLRPAVCRPEILVARSEPSLSTSGNKRHAASGLRNRHK